LYLRLEAGALQEQLQLFLDAMQTYDDIIALGSRRDERWRRSAIYAVNAITLRRAGAGTQAEGEQPSLYIADEGWRSKRARAGLRPAVSRFRGTDRQRALLLARYRYSLVLGFSEVFLAQWLRHVEKGATVTARDLERDRLRARLLPRLSRYSYTPSDGLRRLGPNPARDDVASGHYIVEASSADTQSRLLRLEKDLRRAVDSVALRARDVLAAAAAGALNERLLDVFEIARDPRPMSTPVLRESAQSLIAATTDGPPGAWRRERSVAGRVLDQLAADPLGDLPRDSSPVEIARVLATQRDLVRAASRVGLHLASCDGSTQRLDDYAAHLQPTTVVAAAAHSPSATAEALQVMAVAILRTTDVCPHRQWRKERDVAAQALPRVGGRILDAVTPSHDKTPVEVARRDRLEEELRRTVRLAQRKAARSPDCSAAHQHFGAQFRDAADFAAELKRPTDQELRMAAKSLLAATSLCDAKDWSAERAQARRVVDGFGAGRRHVPTTIQVLCAQELLQQAARAEMGRLVHDYRWWTGRRRRGISVSQAALRVSMVWSDLRLARVRWLIEQELDAVQWPRDQQAEPEHRWPPDVGGVRRDISRALRTRPWRLHTWQDYYNAACAYAIPLLSANSWAGQSTDHTLAVTQARLDASALVDSELASAQFTIGAVRALERAIDRSDSSFVASRRNWLAVADPDLVGLRTRPEYARFQARNFPSMSSTPVLPKTVHALQLSAYVTELTKALASAMIARWRYHLATVRKPLPASDMRVWIDTDRESWRRVLVLAREHRDWRVRHDALLYLRTQSTVDGSDASVPYPVYPDERIGDLRRVSAQGDLRAITAASTNARQERVAQVERLAALIAGHLASPSTGTGVGEEASPEDARRLASCEIAAWTCLRECLSLNFFTDDRQDLHATKLRSESVESQLEAQFAALADMGA
jgi:hypothetical protein